MIDEVTEHVYLSGAGPVLSDHGRKKLQELRISHVLTVSAVAVPPEKRIPHVDYKFIFAMDMSEQDVLSRLEEGVQYIEEVVENEGNILVHCEAGMSRSVTFVAAYLMKKNRWSVDKSIMCIRNSRPSVQPNQGFLQQLETFHSLNYAADAQTLSRSQKYKLWCTRTGNLPQADAALSTTATTSTCSEESDREKNDKYRCGKCRQIVFYDEHLVKHNRCDGEQCEFRFLIEPMKWMKTDEYQGKICCPSCGEKLGNYSWGGRQCQGECGMSCSEQIQPWVHLHKTKIDKVAPRPPIIPVSAPPAAMKPEIPTVIIT